MLNPIKEFTKGVTVQLTEDDYLKLYEVAYHEKQTLSRTCRDIIKEYLATVPADEEITVNIKNETNNNN